MLWEDFRLNVSFFVKHSTKKKIFNDEIWRWNEYMNIILIDSSTRNGSLLFAVFDDVSRLEN